MSATMISMGIDRLPRAEQIALALEIWESLGDARPSGGLTDEERAELRRRDAELDAHPERALTWASIRQAVEGNP